MAATKEKGLAKADDRLKKSDFREKLRSMRSIPLLKKNETEKKTGPLIAKPTLQFTQKSSCTTQHKNDIPRYRGSRTPSPPRSESTFTRQAVHNYRSFSPGPPSRRSRSPTYTRSSSPSSPSSSRRTPSPTGFDTAFQEEIKKRVQKVLRARLYLLQQIGPNSFMIGGDSPMHKFRVIIGPQSCSCGHGPHCVHLLFVMLRVFQVSESDARLWSRTLKNYEVESLFKNYHARRDVRVKNCNSFKDIKTHTSTSSNHPNLAESKSEMSNKDEEEICPICLLEMLDGESLVSCEVGCHNKLHHHCIAIWAEECRRQKEPVICPLCRAEWRKHKESNRESSRQRILSSNRMQRNSESVFRENDIVLPNSELIPQKYLAIALPWTQIFGEEVVACLFSQDWMSREIALRYLSKEIKSLFATSQNNSVSSLQESRPQEILHSCCSVLAYMAGDSFYKVFIASLKCLRSMLAYVSCQNEQDLTLLQENLRPFIKTILLKCADNNRRTSQLSISTLMELCRGQRGELAIGRETSFAWQDGIGGVGYLLSCIMENDNSDTLYCQGLLGRLFAIDKLMEEFPRDFCLLYIKGRQSNSSQVHISDTDNLVNYERLISLINFSVNAISNQHSTVSKMAKHVFLSVSRRATHIPSVFSEFCEKLQILEPGIQHRLLRRLRVIAQEFQAAIATPTSNRPSIFNDDADWLQIKNNKKLINNKLNSSEFFHDHVNKSYKEFKINNLEVGQDLLTPPATPEHHFQRSLSVPTISSFHSQNIEKLEERDLIDFSEPPEKQKSNIINGKVDKSAFSNKAAISKEEKLIPPSTLNISSNSLNTSTSDDLSDLTDITMTQFCDDRMITFKSEVTTPKNSPTHQPSRVLLHLCKEELEEEEAIALAIAMETSIQEALPHIPGLSSDNSDEVITIHLQPEMGENGYHPHIYLENIHWVRGPLLGTGAYSSCYQVRDVKSGTLMAVKQVSFCRNSSDEQQRVTQAIKEEIVMMAKLHHPNVLRIMGATQQRGHFNMFVEWMPGGSVAGLLDKYGTFAESVIINYTQQVLRGLAYLHDNHILHRDLKGANLLVDSTGQHLRIGDFGAAARLASNATGAGEFQGQLLGTIAFMAPEVLRGEDYGRNCDIWSIGCVMIEMATAKPPWNAHDLSNHLALIFKIACSTGPPSIPDHLSPGARDLALRCLERNSEDRPPAKELLKHPVFHLNTT